MRTTIRLPDDLYELVRAAADREGRTLDAFIEESIRAHLRERVAPWAGPHFRIDPIEGGRLQSGIDLDDSSALTDLIHSDPRLVNEPSPHRPQE